MYSQSFIYFEYLMTVVICYSVDFNLKDSDVPGTDFYKVAGKGNTNVESRTLRDTDEVGGTFEGYADFEDYQDYDYYGNPTDGSASEYASEAYGKSMYETQLKSIAESNSE